MTGSNRTDAEMIRSSLEDPEEFRIVFHRHFGPVCRYLSRRVGPSAAEDIASEVFLQAFRNRRVYDPTYPDARPWLFGIASNELHRRRRDEERRLRAYARACEGERQETDVQAQALGGGLSRRLASGLAGLNSKDRDVLLLFAWAELSYEEIAVALRIPVGTVRSRLNRARNKVRAALGDAREERSPASEPPSNHKEYPWMISS